jgi:hypothetical protein
MLLFGRPAPGDPTSKGVLRPRKFLRTVSDSTICAARRLPSASLAKSPEEAKKVRQINALSFYLIISEDGAAMHVTKSLVVCSRVQLQL